VAFRTLKQDERLDNPIVVDNSVMMRWLFQDGSDSNQAHAHKVLTAIGSQALQVIVPYLWVYESAFVVEYYSRRNQLAHEPCMDQLTWLFDLCTVVRGDETPADLYAFSDTQGVSAYDAAYAMLALGQSCPIATLDKMLIKASGRAKYILFEP
jgi:predicted nucleic acid-binding protein